MDDFQRDVPLSKQFDEHYWSGGADEKWHVFVEGNGLVERFGEEGDFVVGELGFGTGLTFVLAAALWQELAAPDEMLTFVSYELYPLTVKELEEIHASFPDEAQPMAAMLRGAYNVRAGWNSMMFGNVMLKMFVGDAAIGIGEQTETAQAWFLDGFSPLNNEAMWTPELLVQVGELTADGGTASTYTVAVRVRKALETAGFTVAQVEGFPPKGKMTVAKKVA